MSISPIYTTTPDSVSVARRNMLGAVESRAAWEHDNNNNPANLASITKYLETFHNRVKREDAFTLGYFAANASEFGAVFQSHRVKSAQMNVYAFPKCLSGGRALNGAALRGDDANDETIMGVVLAIARGVSNQVRIANALNEFMCRDGKRMNYSSGATQAGSALRALEALGVVREIGREGSCKLWGIGDAGKFERLLDAANGVAHTGESNPAPAPMGEIIEGTCEELRDVPALGWDVVDTSVDVTEAEVIAASPMLALPAPAPKAKRKRSK